MFTQEEIALIREKAREAEEYLLSVNFKTFYGCPQDEPLLLISTQYPGVWLEHAWDSVFFGRLFPEKRYVGRNMVELFLRHQSAEGQFPLAVLDRPDPKDPSKPEIFDFQIQEVVSFGQLALEVYEYDHDPAFLARLYDAFSRWDAWLCKYRMTSNRGLIEMFCGFDTGMDNSGRNIGLSCPNNYHNQNASVLPIDDVVPILAPDMNVAFWGDRMALSKMAELLGKPEEAAAWKAKADEVKRLIFHYCFNEEDLAFYDVDKHGNQRKCLCIVMARMFYYGFLDQELADKIFQRHFENPEEFNTPCPLPSVAASDPTFNKDCDFNSWGYFVQGDTSERTALWLDAYGKSAYYDHFLEVWMRTWTYSENVPFGQEVDPITCLPSESSPWYTPTLQLYIYGARRFGIV